MSYECNFVLCANTTLIRGAQSLWTITCVRSMNDVKSTSRLHLFKTPLKFNSQVIFHTTALCTLKPPEKNLLFRNDAARAVTQDTTHFYKLYPLIVCISN